jgi:hypothetical protein
MPQDQQLAVFGGGRAAHQQGQTEHLWKIRYNSHSDTAVIMPTSAGADHRWSTGVHNVLEPHRMPLPPSLRDARSFTTERPARWAVAEGAQMHGCSGWAGLEVYVRDQRPDQR